MVYTRVMVSDKPFWTATQLAEEAGVSARYVRADIKAGILKATRPGHEWLIMTEDARQWLANPKRGSRAKKRKAE